MLNNGDWCASDNEWKALSVVGSSGRGQEWSRMEMVGGSGTIEVFF